MSYVTARTEGAQDAPLVFTFHGTGGDEHQFHAAASALVPGARVVSPRGDVSEAGMNRFFRRTGEGVYDMDDLARRTEAMANFLSAEKKAAGDPPTIGLGYSNGANILASVAFARPEIVDCIVLMHPLIPFTPDPQPGLSGRHILITAGRRDPICPAPATQALADWLEGQGAQVTLKWTEGGHEIRAEETEAVRAFFA